MAASTKPKAADMYRCIETFHAAQPAFTGTVTKGELVRGNHAAVKAFPQFFERVDDIDRPEIEAATAAPGQKR